MVFNWFRRQFDDSSQNSADVEAEPAASEQVEAPSQETAAEPNPELDYLSWAKAAYKNIQQRQAESEIPQETSEPTSEVEAPEAPDQPAIAAESAIQPKGEPTQETPASSPVAETALSPETELASESPEPKVTPSSVAAVTPAAEPVPETSEAAPTSHSFEPVAAPINMSASPTEVEPKVAAVEPQEPDAAAKEIVSAEAPVASEPPESEPVAIVSKEADPEQPLATESAIAAEKLDANASAPPAVPETALIASHSAPSPADDSSTTEEVTPASATEAMPFWARGEADRQERLERLKATAIVEPAPEVASSPAPVSAATTPVVDATAAPETDITLDEGFLWSAEILAAQGRRPDEISVDEITWLQKLRRGLDKTRRGLVNQLKLIVGQGPLNQEAVMEIESLLLQADVGVEATDTIITALQDKLRQETLPPEAAIAYLKQILRDLLDQPIRQTYSPTFAPEKDALNIWLLTGVNGAGKTTTIGKIAHVAKESGYDCLIAAADTFRAAAVEQVKIWGQRSQVEVIANPGKNTDPAAVVFDAIGAAQAKQTDLLLVDTAGRLQNKKNLMDELRKIRRIADKKAPDARIESLLVLDATLGQNGLRQAQVFSEAAQLTGVVLTKLDGTAKGGVALAVVQQLGLPIRFIGAGEGIADLRPFSSYEFVEALLSS